MTHNEEATIEETIRAVLSQEVGKGSTIEIHVFANGCTDNTEYIVGKIVQTNNNCKLHSIPEKGKVSAIRECIRYFKNNQVFDSTEAQAILFFIDADIAFPRKDVLSRLREKLVYSPHIYVVSAFPVPETYYNQNTNFVSELSRIRCHLQYSFKENYLRGACYAVRWSVLKRIVFPRELLSDDMFLECKLNGHFQMDHDLKVICKLKKSLKLEIQRELFLLIAREQVYFWRRNGLIPRLHPETAVKDGFLSNIKPRQYLYFLSKNRQFSPTIISGIWMLIHKCIEVQAKKIFYKSLRNDVNLIDYWSTKR